MFLVCDSYDPNFTEKFRRLTHLRCRINCVCRGVPAAVQISQQGFIMRYAVLSHRHGRLAAEGSGRIVSLDYRSGSKIDLPPDIAERLRGLQ